MKPTVTEDHWSLWFFRIMQMLGAGGFLHELLLAHDQRVWILCTVVAMMLGSQGMTMLLRAGVNRAP